MTQILSFPKLGLEFTMDRVAFYLPEFLGSRPVYWYGIIIAIAFLVALSYILSRTKTFGLDTDRVFDVVFFTIILGIIGARLYYVAFSWSDFKDDLVSIFKTWEGGLAIYGGIIFGILGIIIGCAVRKVKLVPMMDLAVGGVLIGQAIGRWGNFVNIEAFGGNTNLPWGMTGPAIVNYLTLRQEELGMLGMNIDPMMPVHPTFLYESLWCLLGFLLIAFLTKKRRFDGQLTLTYFAWYGIGRFFIEGLRTDSLLVGSLRISQIIGLVTFIVATLALVLIFAKIKRENDPNYLSLYANSDEAKLIVAGKFYDNEKIEETENNNEDDEYLEQEDTQNDTEDNLKSDEEDDKENLED